MFSGLRRRSRSVGFRLTAWTSGFFFLSTVALMALVYAQLRTHVIAREREMIDLRAGFMATAYARTGLDSVVQYSLRTGTDGLPLFFVEVTSPTHEPVYVSDHPRWAQFAAGRAAAVTVPEPGASEWASVPGDDGTLEMTTRRLHDGNVLRVGRATADSRRVLKSFRELSVLSLALVVPLSVLTGGALARRTLQPIRTLHETVETIIATGRFSSRVPTSGSGDEVDELVVQFNEMLAHIERLMTGLSESLDHVAHDLRTPLTRLYNSAQSALRNSRDPDVLSEALADCVEEADRVLVTVRRLMELTAAEGRVAKFDRRPLDLAALAVEVADLFRELADEHGVAVRVDTAREAVALADHEAMRRVLSNLLDNAIKFAKAGTIIDVEVRQTDGTAVVSVTDRGDGIAAEDLPHIWNRFFRGGRERASEGAGLGLSIVKAVVEAHGGTVHATSEPGTRTVFTVRLPAQAAAHVA